MGSEHLNKALHSVTSYTCATFNSTALSLEIENLSNPPAGFEAEMDTDCVQTFYNWQTTMKMKEMLLWSAVSLEVLPGNHGFLYAILDPHILAPQ